MSVNCDPRREVIERALRNILASEEFRRSKRLSQFLSYIVQECLEGRQDRIKAYAIGVSVFDRPENFDPNIDPLVRIEAGRLRRALERYYYNAHDPIQIDVPKGGYVPTFKPSIALVGSPDAGADPQPRISFIEGSRSAISPSRWGVRITFAASIVAAALLYAGHGIWTAHPEKPLFAVLPFTMTGGDFRAQQIASGVSEEVMSVLAGQDGVSTLSRAATDRLGKASAREGQSFNVRYFVEGSVSTSEAKGVVAARLIDARGGHVLWSARYAIVPDDDLVTLQSDLGRGIAQEIIGPNGALERLRQPQGAFPRRLEAIKAQQARLFGLL